MRTSRIFVPQPLEKEKEVTLTGDAFNYIMNVLRLTIGDQLHLFNGTGGQWLATIIAYKKRHVTCKLNIFLHEVHENPLKIHLGQALSRGERMDYAIKKGH